MVRERGKRAVAQRVGRRAGNLSHYRTLSHRSKDGALSLEGEGWGEGEHTALVDIPFTLCSLLLCNDMTGERARVAQSPPPWRPGLPAVNRRFAVPSAYSFRLVGDGRRQRPCKARPLGASLRLAPAFRKRLSDLQPDQVVAVSH